MKEYGLQYEQTVALHLGTPKEKSTSTNTGRYTEK